MNNIKLMTNFKSIRGFVSAISAVLLCCSWYSVAMAQAVDEGSAPQVRVRIFLEAPLGTAVMAPLAVRVVTDGPVLQLARRGDEATAQVEVVIYARNTADDLTMTISTDAAGSEVVTVPSYPIMIVAADGMMRRTAQFALTAKEGGEAIVFITVAGDGNEATTSLRIEVAEGGAPPQSSLTVIEPQADTAFVWRLLSGETEVTTQVRVIIDASDTAADLRMTISTDAAGDEVVAVPSVPIVIAADGTAMQRSVSFELTAKTTGTAIVRIAVTDGASTATVALRVVVADQPPMPQYTLAVIEPQADTAFVWRLLSGETEATTQVRVIIDASDTAADLRMRISTDAAGAEVVAVPSEPIVIGADGAAMRRSAEFELTAKTIGMATLRIAVTDGTSTTMVALRLIVVADSPIAIISPQANTELQLLSRGADSSTQVQVVIDASDTAAELRMTVSTDGAGAEVVTIPSDPIIIAADGNAMRRSESFELTAKKAGMAVVRIAVSDGASTETVVLRVIVEELPHTIAVVEPQTDTELRLLSRGDEAMAQVQIVIDASDTAAELRMTISTDESGAEVVAIPSDPIIVEVAGTAMRRSAEFELMAKTTGTATVTIAVTDGASTDTVVLRVVVAELTLEILSPSDGTQIALLRGDESLAATQVEVMLVQTNVEVPIALDLQLERIAGSPVFISTTSLTLTASADGSTRTRFTLAAAEMGNTTLTLVASDRLGNRAVVSVRVSVERRGELCASCLVPDMVTVSAGTFTMGSPSGEGQDSERPQHQVNIGYAFAVGQYALTRGQYRAFVDASGYAAGNDWLNPGFTQSDAHPVVYVSWDDAKEYLSWLSEQTGEEWRLLSEAEWEYAARAGTTTSYAFGDTINATQARFNSRTGTVAVGSYAANAFALYDMHGNVWEWVEDCWHGNYNEAPTDGSAWVNECTNAGRVVRGGAWNSIPGFLRSAIRFWDVEEAMDRDDYGFRVARTLEP